MNKINSEYQRHLDVLSGLPGLGAYEQQAEIGDRMARGELVQVNEVWYERVDLGDEAATAVRRAVQAEDEARPHDDEPVNLCETDADMAARFAGQIGELTTRIETALSWIDEPDDATPEIQLAKIRAALTGQARRG